MDAGELSISDEDILRQQRATSASFFPLGSILSRRRNHERQMGEH